MGSIKGIAPACKLTARRFDEFCRFLDITGELRGSPQHLYDLEAYRRHCQANTNQSRRSSKVWPSGRQLTPLVQGGGAVPLEDGAAGEVTVVVEVVIDGGLYGGEFLQGLDGPELRHCRFSSSERLV